MAEYRSIRVERGSGGFGGPLVITPTEKRNKVMFITGGGAELITHGKGEIGGPLNQYSTVGWKQIKAAEILVDKYMVKIYSSASQASLITANN